MMRGGVPGRIARRIATGFGNLKLKRKILIYNACIVLVITAAFSFFATHLAEDRIVARVGERNAESLRIVDGFLGELEALVEDTFGRLEDDSRTRGLIRGDVSTLPGVEALMAELAKETYITEINLYNMRGETLARYGGERSMYIGLQLLSRILRNGKELYWYNSSYENSTTVEALSVYRTFQINETTQGIMHGRLNTTEIADIYTMIGSNIGVGVYLLNGRGSIILPRNRDKTLLALSRDRLSRYARDSERPEKTLFQDVAYLVYETYLQEYDLFAICITLYEDVVEDVSLFRHLVMLLGTVCLLLVVGSSLWMANWVSKPIMRLASDMEKVRGGDLTLRLHNTAQDEIGILSRTYDSMLDRLVALMEEIERTQRQKREMELTALQMQITPHFLYNSLESLSALALIGDDQTTYVMSNALSMFYRGVLSDGRSIIRISEEIDIIRNYLEVQFIRYRDVFSYEIDVDEDVNTGGIVKLSLQPLVENAIYHGVRGIRWPGVIRVEGRRVGADVVFSVIDNGKGMAQTQAEQAGDASRGDIILHKSGLGMRNVDRRLKLYYGSDFGLTVVPTQQGTHVQLRLPYAPYEE